MQHGCNCVAGISTILRQSQNKIDLTIVHYNYTVLILLHHSLVFGVFIVRHFMFCYSHFAYCLYSIPLSIAHCAQFYSIIRWFLGFLLLVIFSFIIIIRLVAYILFRCSLLIELNSIPSFVGLWVPCCSSFSIPLLSFGLLLIFYSVVYCSLHNFSSFHIISSIVLHFYQLFPSVYHYCIFILSCGRKVYDKQQRVTITNQKDLVLSF